MQSSCSRRPPSRNLKGKGTQRIMLEREKARVRETATEDEREARLFQGEHVFLIVIVISIVMLISTVLL